MVKKYEKEKNKKIAKERIESLFSSAEKECSKHPERSNRYVEIARSIAMKFRVKLPSKLKRRFCKKCNSFLVPGKNCRVRMKSGKVVYTCLNCAEVVRLPHLKEKKPSRPSTK
ncbi:ribonuclease P [Candidatus Woesearchaeota archaeon]|nr:ribonuclease P [Candidatus Woesearchaeota archaeon]